MAEALSWHMSVSPSHLATHVPSSLSNYLVRTWALILMKDFSISFPANVSRKQTQKESQVDPALTLRLQRSPSASFEICLTCGDSVLY